MNIEICAILTTTNTPYLPPPKLQSFLLQSKVSILSMVQCSRSGGLCARAGYRCVVELDISDVLAVASVHEVSDASVREEGTCMIS